LVEAKRSADVLVSRAAELERELQIEHGSFSNRPKGWLKYGFVPVEHRWPIGLIYAAAASLWIYLLTTALVKDRLGLIWLKFTTPAVVIACWQGLRWMESARRAKQREAVKSLMEQLLGSNDADSQGKLVETIAAQQPILGIDKIKAKRRVAYHWKGYEQKRDGLRMYGAAAGSRSQRLSEPFHGRLSPCLYKRLQLTAHSGLDRYLLEVAESAPL
jgi:hypothetical protein